MFKLTIVTNLKLIKVPHKFPCQMYSQPLMTKLVARTVKFFGPNNFNEGYCLSFQYFSKNENKITQKQQQYEEM